MSPHVPGRGQKRSEQASGENTASLEGVQAEDFADVRGVVAPLIDDVKHFGAHNAAKDDEDSKIPSLVAVVSQALGVTHTDPKPDQDAHRYQESVGRKKELS